MNDVHIWRRLWVTGAPGEWEEYDTVDEDESRLRVHLLNINPCTPWEYVALEGDDLPCSHAYRPMNNTTDNKKAQQP
jgi:muconolactone delta-isomerase